LNLRVSRRELTWLPIVALALLAIYLPSLGNAPVFDDAYLTEGDLFRLYGSWSEPRARMLSYGSFVWVHALFGDGWWKQRLVNVLLHIGVASALWAFWRAMLAHIAPPRPEPGSHAPATSLADSAALPFAIGFFALNPVAVYAVAYLVQRSIIMATLFVVLALWAFVRGLETQRWGFHVAAFAFYILSVMSKEYALFAPLAAVPVYLVVARPGARRVAALGGAGAALITLAGLFLYWRYGEIIGKPFDEFSRVYVAQLAALNPDAQRHAFALSILNEAYLFFQYGLRWFIPAAAWMSINLRPPFPVAFGTFPQVLGIFGYLALVAGGFVLVLRYRDWRALAGLAVLLPALLYPTEFVTVWVQDPFVLYRSYLWAIGVPGLVFLLLHGFDWKVIAGIGAAVGALFVWQGLDRVFSLESPESAWTDAIDKLPKDERSVGRWFPYLNRGTVYVDRNDFRAALHDFQASSRLGDMGLGVYNMGAVFAATGHHEQALVAFDRAEQQGYDLYNLPFQRGLSLLALRRPEEAYKAFQVTRSRNPPSPTREALLLNMGRTALQLGKKDDAIVLLTELVTLQPRNPEVRYLYAMALIGADQHEGARRILDDLVQEGAKAPAYYARAIANYGLRRKHDALADIDTAIRLGPDSPVLREWQAKIRAMP
jgi:tetratricopeptide (TPR) repeat protein